jgi:uncharacterized phage protein gp47/JayE
MDLPTFPDLFQIARDEMLSRNGQLALAEVDRQGSDLNIIVGAIAAGADEVVGQLARVAKSRSLATAKGQELDVLVYDRYQLIRKPASPAYTHVHFSTTAAAAAAFTIPDSTLLSAADGLQFITVGDVTYPIGSTGPVRATVRSLEAGPGQRAGIGTITSIVTQITGAPADLAATNPAATFGGDDSETDEELVTRARRFFVDARRGTVGAIRSAILSVPGIKTCEVFENIDILGRPVGPVNAVVSDAYTDLFAQNGAPASYQIQSDAMVNQILQFLIEHRAAGIAVDITVGQVVLQGVQLSLAYIAGYDTDGVNTAVQSTVIQYINTLPPGRALTLDGLYSQIRMVPGLNYSGQEVVSPRGTVTVGGGQVMRTNTSLVRVL